MKILGISGAVFHDCSAALLIDSEVLSGLCRAETG